MSSLQNVGLPSAPPARDTSTQVTREWVANMHLTLAPRQGRTALLRATHKGPLRVQRLFYPEARIPDQICCAHVYLLHPPGGLVVGDRLSLKVDCAEAARGLLTTPSAGKIYSVEGLRHSDPETCQHQTIHLKVEAGASCEWLPQETIVYAGANARLTTRLDLAGDAKACLWDIVCLGRPASGEQFTSGSVRQDIECWHEGVPLLIERNRLQAETAMLTSAWGLKGCNSFGSMIATVTLTTEQADELQLLLDELTRQRPEEYWGLTQKGPLLIARYIGNNAGACRQGFAKIWAAIRPLLIDRIAVTPRIWLT